MSVHWLEWLFYGLQWILLALLISRWEYLKGPTALFAIAVCTGVLVQLWVRWEWMQGRGYYGLFNAYSLLETLIWCLFYARISHYRRARLAAGMGFVVYLLAAALLIAYGFNPFTGKSMLLYSIEAILILLLSLAYFYHAVLSDKLQDPTKDSIFWIVSGNLLFYGVCWVTSSLLHLVANHYPDLEEGFLYVLRVSNIALSGVYIYAVICLNRAGISSSQ